MIPSDSTKLKQLGIDEEALLNGSEEEFNKLKDAYMNIVFQLNEGNGCLKECADGFTFTNA